MNPDYHHEELIQQICSGNIPLPDYGENMEKFINQLLFPMLNPDPCQRPNADELLKYHIFDKIQLQEKQKSVKKPNVLKKFFDSILEEIQENKK
ncbi:hypothetical protein TRFO_38104 [Tritrichomonas foetus]|uniref:Protein kinase domain-containing protein n=1 Tax=Tritrichomonas foetus TaxID=1144522 RepID=A0A1J4JBZ9_9EUKA|nr:hypothetical protein TRFO_38104 [Tritrichomonas foetus]|eukprot:OHS95775.1 hypothetical protein TRFO_38104 [Tritrichomonas foetus]